MKEKYHLSHQYWYTINSSEAYQIYQDENL